MRIIEKIQKKTREEYLSIVNLWIARLSGSIQQKPLQFFAAGVGAGVLFVLLSGLLIPALVLAACLAAVVYFIAPEKKL